MRFFLNRAYPEDQEPERELSEGLREPFFDFVGTHVAGAKDAFADDLALTIDEQQTLRKSVVSLGHFVVHVIHNRRDGDVMGSAKPLRLPPSFFKGGMGTIILPSVVDEHKL